MGWLISAIVSFIVVYNVIGGSVFAWYIHSNDSTYSAVKKSSAKILILFFRISLFWPIALVIELKRRRSENLV